LGGNYEHYLEVPLDGVFRGKTRSRTQQNTTDTSIHRQARKKHNTQTTTHPCGKIFQEASWTKGVRWREKKGKKNKKKKHKTPVDRANNNKKKNKA